ncbi:hypothetical protein CORC01_14306 [Colletotrichum orchidophilum]|uniref:Uncharacterized protein n=1 Tax=Colletotrichum orchidophilum TaxID=1209926 RepID=A0A1G4AMT7_9PEZI|nr:uncharacterized protein CORC01_14306 [Colletotrichum orchidophilum]OHE90395.1 hypothetical protein CORC01_14306 [Colletotrichum orchidophilum]
MHKHYTYTSSNEPSWPRTKAEMERMYPVSVTRTPQDFVGKRNRASTIHTPQGTAAEENDASCCSGERSSNVDRRNVLALNHDVDAYSCDTPVGQETIYLSRRALHALHGKTIKSDSSKRVDMVN